MGKVTVTLVRQVRDPSGYVVSADDCDGLREAVEASDEAGLPTVTALSQDVSRRKAEELVSFLASEFEDAFIVGSGGDEEGAVVFGRLHDFEPEDIVYLSQYASLPMVRRLSLLCHEAAALTAHVETKQKWYDVLVEVEKVRGDGHAAHDSYSRGDDTRREDKDSDAPASLLEVKKPVGDRVELDSSAIAAVTYLSTGTLTVELRSGLTQIFRGVPYHVYEGLLGAESAGRYFGEKIQGNFEFDVTPMPEFDDFPVRSEAISKVSRRGGYLYVEFTKGGAVYRYGGVPIDTVMRLLVASSPMRYFQDEIKDQFPTERVTTTGEKRPSKRK